ncbi:HDOD domain-containing protein [Vibrio fluvialis]|uniref:HDOD domain-containing protein n=1 Tax=Vibrio fluvialis TaxID=676 RepID=UPI001EEBD608|nr:HDOD domain-containing protein [Vibrio fluvialis]MCG6399792.1 HDOD domain-containing protein [Vibrio fluvialis]
MTISQERVQGRVSKLSLNAKEHVLHSEIITNRRYSEETNSVAEMVANVTRMRYFKWLVSRKFVLDQDNVDTTLSDQARYCDSVIVSERERVTPNQRLLLECESLRLKDKRQKLEQRQRVHENVLQEVLALTETMMRDQLLATSPVQFFGRFPDFSYFTDIAYSPSLNISKLAVLTANDPMLRMEVLSLMKDERFLERIHRKPKQSSEPKVAIGTLGIDNCVRLFPILMSKSLVKWQEPAIKNIAPKLWQYMMVTANTTCLRLEVAGWRYPEQGLLLGVLHSLGMFTVVNQYPSFFKEALASKMQQYREQHKREEYYACAEVTLDMSVLPNLLTSLSQPLTRNILDYLSWAPSNQPIRIAIEEELNNVPILERSLLGIALAQGSAFSIYDSLERSKVFIDKHKPFWFARVQMSAKDVSFLGQSHTGRLQLLEL